MLNSWIIILLISIWIIALLTNLKWKKTRNIYFINLAIAIGYTAINLMFFSEGREGLFNLFLNAFLLIIQPIVLIIYRFFVSKPNK